MKFRDVFKSDSEKVYPGMCVVHSVAPLAGIRITWVTRIVAVEDKKRFVDTQVKGPFALWHHIHEFCEVPGGTEIRDILYYEVPFGILGDLAHNLFVKRQIRTVFLYRSERLKAMF
jgi:ligand-binding SRPBCC domain-containing protein